ncbi:unnamed protein product [Danaus chrysippus]|uniref:(African queen) hypothetical protein n=1 Tax=Danaus chrysippus TaxID=151541 RepID=A0A8J2QQ29_9NEOP|nr:unnamed protein product [Danaus chrysippus]
MKSTLDVRYSQSPAKMLAVRSDGDLATTQSDSDDLSSEQRQCHINSMKLLPERCYSQSMLHAPTAYVLESPKVYSDVFNYDTGNESCSAPEKVELIVLQNTTKNNFIDNKNFKDINNSQQLQKSLRHSIASALDAEGTDDELINEEALKTIYALIKLTKEKVINKMQDKSTKQNTPNWSNLKKYHSENKVYESDVGSSQENTPQKKNNIKFNTWRGQLTEKPKRRPLSLSIPTDITIPDDYLNDDEVMNKTSLKSIKSSLNSIDSKAARGTLLCQETLV